MRRAASRLVDACTHKLSTRRRNIHGREQKLPIHDMTSGSLGTPRLCTRIEYIHNAI